MNRKYGFRIGRQHFADSICCKRLADRIYVREHWPCTPADGAGGGGDESAAGNNHLVPSSDSQRVKRQFESHGSVCDGDCVLTAGNGGKLGFKPSPLLTSPVIELSRPQDGGRCFNFVFG